MYKITVIYKDSEVYYNADDYSKDGEYILMIRGKGERIVNLRPTLDVHIEVVDGE